ncbi:MAG: PD-(D/E)XK nuclease family protein [bacterium]
MWADNVVSWDRFKEEAFGAYEERRPANRLMRRIFAEHYLKANAVRPRLERLIAPSYAAYSGRYAAALTLLLPHLVALRSAAGALRSTTGATASGPHGVSAVRRDLEQLHAAYGSFLDEHGLFEPQWRSATLTEPAEMTALIACDLATDFPEYHPALEKSDRILLLGAPRWFRSSARLRRYPTVAQEITDVLLRVEALLADGVPGHEIAVTVGDLPTLRDRIQLEASARGVPIVIRQGRPLAEYSAVALFPLMASAVSEDFRFERFRDLVLHGAVPWRDRGELRRRLTAAAARGILRITDVDATLGALARRIRGIATAQTFAAIRERLYVFFAQYLDTGSLPADQERAFQAALDVLTELAREEERGLPVLEDPFGFFVSLLADRQYVPRDEAGGVAVYPYRVSACIAPQHHFVLNCSQSATKVSGAGAVQLIPETDHEALGIDAYDVSHAMLGAYAASGDAVTFTFSDRGPGGAQLPAESFTTASLQELADRLEDPLDLERRYLGGESPTPPERVYPAQRSGLSHIIGSVERAAEGDRAVTAAPVPPELWRRRDDKGNADIPTEITVSELERYWNCPLGYLMEFVYGVRDPDTVPLPADPRHIGTLYHRVLQRLYEWIKERDGVLDASHGERYREQAREIAREVLSKSATPLRDVAEYAYLALLDQITDFVITWDLDNFDGYEVYALEAPFSYPSEAAPVAGDLMGLRGRIDRVLRNSETGDVVVADYKRRNVPGRRTIELELTDRPAAVPGAADPDRELSLQMAAYAYLLERNGLSVEAALYFNLEEAKTSLVYGGAGNPWLNREQLDTLIARIEERLSALPGRLRDGDFRVPTPDWGCAACRMRGVCRERFVVR